MWRLWQQASPADYRQATPTIPRQARHSPAPTPRLPTRVVTTPTSYYELCTAHAQPARRSGATTTAKRLLPRTRPKIRARIHNPEQDQELSLNWPGVHPLAPHQEDKRLDNYPGMITLPCVKSPLCTKHWYSSLKSMDLHMPMTTSNG